MFWSYKRITLALATASMILSISDAEPIAAGEDTNVEQCLDPETCPIPYSRLSKQETEPFLFLGKKLDEEHPLYDQYQKALSRFPNVRSCLTEEEREKPLPDLRQINWDQIETTQEIDVCIFRIAASIDDMNSIRDWLLYHGFRLGEPHRLRSSEYSPKHETEPTSGFAAYLTVDQFREIIPRTWFAKMMGFEGVRGYSLSILFSESKKVVDVTSSGGTIFN